MNNMKKQNIFLPLLMIGFLCSSCDDYLNENPDNRAELDTQEKISSMLVSAYPSVSSCFLAETVSDNTDMNEQFSAYNDRLQEEVFFWKEITEVIDDSPQDLWEGCYRAIASANMALTAIEEMGSSADLLPKKGEALLCRAYGHFVLVNVFCKHFGNMSSTDLGIPYIKTPETFVSPEYGRGTVAGVYKKIEEDIEAGLPLLEDKSTAPKYHFNKDAAYAFAARFNLYYRKYDKAIEYATQVLGSNPATKLRNWKNAGQTNIYDIRGNEFISSSNSANLLLTTAYSSWGYINGPYYTGCYYTHNPTISAYETTASTGPWGTSSTYSFGAVNLSAVPKTIVYKINGYFEYTDPVNGIGYRHVVLPVFTTDETLLCRAEAYAMKEEFDQSVADLAVFMKAFTSGTTLTRANINEFYENKVGYYTWKQPTVKKKLHPDFTITAGEQENFIQCILHIRRILTVHEGLRWFDIKRYGIEIYRRSIAANGTITVLDSLKVNDPRRVFQLPQSVISAGLEKNRR